MLDKWLALCYSIQARLREIAKEKSEVNLENDTEIITRNKEKDSEDSKEFNIERCLKD